MCSEGTINCSTPPYSSGSQLSFASIQSWPKVLKARAVYSVLDPLVRREIWTACSAPHWARSRLLFRRLAARVSLLASRATPLSIRARTKPVKRVTLLIGANRIAHQLGQKASIVSATNFTISRAVIVCATH